MTGISPLANRMDCALTVSSDLEVDLAIIGAGAAGLLMANEAAAQGRRLRLVVLEPRRIKPNPRLWMFPARPGHALERFVSQRLERVRVDGVDRPLRDDRLDLVRAADVQRAALDQLASAGVGAVEEGVRIDRVETHARGLSLTTSRGLIRALAIIDTRPGPLSEVPAGCWTQINWFAQAPFADIAPGLSISRAAVDGGRVFMEQTFALSDGSALIEISGLCPPDDDGAQVKARLVDRLAKLGLPAESAELRRAVLPLGMDVPKRPGGDRAIYAPAGSGGLRFGAGRAALRLARWARHEARQFARTGRLASPVIASPTERKTGRMLVAKLETGPDAAASWINEALAQREADDVLRFLAAAPPRTAGLWPWRRGGAEA